MSFRSASLLLWVVWSMAATPAPASAHTNRHLLALVSDHPKQQPTLAPTEYSPPVTYTLSPSHAAPWSGPKDPALPAPGTDAQATTDAPTPPVAPAQAPADPEPPATAPPTQAPTDLPPTETPTQAPAAQPPDTETPTQAPTDPPATAAPTQAPTVGADAATEMATPAPHTHMSLMPTAPPPSPTAPTPVPPPQPFPPRPPPTAAPTSTPTDAPTAPTQAPTEKHIKYPPPPVQPLDLTDSKAVEAAGGENAKLLDSVYQAHGIKPPGSSGTGTALRSITWTELGLGVGVLSIVVLITVIQVKKRMLQPYNGAGGTGDVEIGSRDPVKVSMENDGKTERSPLIWK